MLESLGMFPLQIPSPNCLNITFVLHCAICGHHRQPVWFQHAGTEMSIILLKQTVPYSEAD